MIASIIEGYLEVYLLTRRADAATVGRAVREEKGRSNEDQSRERQKKEDLTREEVGKSMCQYFFKYFGQKKGYYYY
jgi:hypothetical protein